MKDIYFTFPYFENRHVLAMARGPWVTFFYRFTLEVTDAAKALDSNATALFLMYLPDLSVLGDFEEFRPSDVPPDVPEIGIYFDVETGSFRAQTKTDEREATTHESLRYCEVQAGTMLPLDGLRLRILEMSYGFIPSFQYRVERVYRAHFEPLVAQMKQEDEAFNGKARKAEFSRLFKSLILPALSAHGFERDTPRSMRLVRRSAELAVFIDFSHISFGSGAYQVAIIWVDGPDAPFDDDRLLGRLAPSFPYHSNLMLESCNPQILAYSVHEWLRVFDLYLAAHISNHLTMDALRAWLDRDKRLQADKKSLALPPLSPRHAYSLRDPARVLTR